VTDLELPEPQIFVPSPVPTSDVFFCTMDSAQDLESQQDLELKLDWYMQIKVEINAMEKNEN